jgi:hypothetical protein
MKIRNGFVSNSSTASFLVRHKDYLGTNKEHLLSKKEIAFLEKLGFYKTYASYPDQIDDSDSAKIKEEDYYNFGYFIICNEHEILEELIKNKIPFIANCHYDQYTVVYERDSKYIDVFINAGKHYSMMLDNTEHIIKKPCGKRLTIKQFLKEGYYI